MLSKKRKLDRDSSFYHGKLNLVKSLQIWLEDLVETGKSDVRNKVGAVPEELLRCNGISHGKYMSIKEDNNIL